MDLVHAGAAWLHTVATVGLLGYYGMLGLFVVPVLGRTVPAQALAESIVALERRALPLLVLALLVLVATGAYLLTADTRYSGVGDVSSSPWATILLVKHLLVAAMVGLGLWADGLVARDIGSGDAAVREAGVRRLGWITLAMTALGAVILLLTAAAQAS